MKLKEWEELSTYMYDSVLRMKNQHNADVRMRRARAKDVLDEFPDRQDLKQNISMLDRFFVVDVFDKSGFLLCSSYAHVPFYDGNQGTVKDVAEKNIDRLIKKLDKEILA